MDKCRENNNRILEGKAQGGYERDVFENLILRYEEPNGMARWDSPLFTVPYDDVTPPSEAIWEALIGSDGQVKTVKPNQATVAVSNQKDNGDAAERKSRHVYLNLITFTIWTKSLKKYWPGSRNG